MIAARLIVVCSGLAAGCALAHATTDTPEKPGPAPANPAATDPAMGTVSGRIAYKGDPERPWRLGRYYIRGGTSGPLAEAVIALSQRGLKGPAGAREPATLSIDQKDFQFTPETIAIRAGDRVKFTNSDAQVHNVQTNHNRQTFNANMQPGGEHVERFANAGGVRQPYRIGCAFHGAMRSWIFVFDHPWFRTTESDGKFVLANVPPGEYRLEIAHPAGELQTSRSIIVKAGETTTIDIELTPDDRQ